MSETILGQNICRKKDPRRGGKTLRRHRTYRRPCIGKTASFEKHRFRSALETPNSLNIIAEFKRASPSKGLINDSVDAQTVARAYENGGAVAISVLTEEDFFMGSLE